MTNDQLERAIELMGDRDDLRNGVERAERCIVALKEGKGFSWFAGDLSQIEILVVIDAVRKIIALRQLQLSDVEAAIKSL
jgi:hypothetical protein